MFVRTIQQFCEITGSRIRGQLSPDATIQHAVIDSRQAQRDSLFFALPGSRTHGICYAANAVSRGAVVVADEEAAQEFDEPLIVASDPLRALQQLARFNRRQSEALVVGITGSVGKTTTRRLLTAVLSTAHQGVQSPANYNNELGVPLSLLQIQDDTEFAVIEMGARRTGDIAELCRMALPEMAIVTRIAPSHLSCFGSIKEIAAAKSELVRSLNPDGVAFLNADDRHVMSMADTAGCRVVSFGQSADADVRYEVLEASNTHLVVGIDHAEFCVEICGEHHAGGVAASVAIARELGLSAEEIQEGLDQFQPAPGRSVLQQIGGIDVIDDSYNANPASVQAAVALLNGWQTSGRRVFVLGDMLDLAEQAAELHFAIGVMMAQTSIDHAVAYGQYAADVADGFLSGGGGLSRISVFEDVSTLLTILDCVTDPGDAMVVKGSRGMAMERIIAGLQPPAEQGFRRAA